MHTLWAILTPLGLLDSINPLAIVPLIFLLGTPHPLGRSVSFILGIFLSYFLAGLLIFYGLGQTLENFLKNPLLVDYIIQFVVGILLLYFGYRIYHAQGDETESKQPTSLAPTHTFLLGGGVTVAGLPMVLPYIAAIDQILKVDLSTLEIFSTFLYYNVLCVVPLVVLVGIFLFAPQQSGKVFQWVNEATVKWGRRIVVSFFVVLGVVLIIDAFAYVMGHPFLIF